MSTEIGDAGDPFRDSGPRRRDYPTIGPSSPWTPGPRSTSTSTSGLQPLFHQPTPQPPTAQPPTALPPSALPPTASALPPTAPIGQMPSPRWANPPDFNDNRVTTMPARTEPVRQEKPSALSIMNPRIAHPIGPNPGPGVQVGWDMPRESLPPRPSKFAALQALLDRGQQRGEQRFRATGELPYQFRNRTIADEAREAPRNRPWSTEAIGDQGDPILPASNRGRPNFYGRPPMPLRRAYPPMGPYEEEIDYGGPGNAYGWGGRNFRRF